MINSGSQRLDCSHRRCISNADHHLFSSGGSIIDWQTSHTITVTSHYHFSHAHLLRSPTLRHLRLRLSA
ncbi:hypothetical protein BDW74DRAFT_71416 [Aspergillus multicolor]|uniref:uncharacterized protein n=1 Tax=Aspergillus multicolor TaxID=41759 RepID=UPI003CCD22F0